MSKDASKIPLGPYCYTIVKVEGNVVQTSPCPYWRLDLSKPEQECGYCEFLGSGDWMPNGTGLLWDSVKECGENMDDERDEPAN